MSILESARRVVDRTIIDAPRKLQVRDADFVESVVLPAGPFIGQAADFATTIYALRNGLVEANPMMKGLVKSLPAFAAVKLAAGVGLGVLVHKTENKKAKKILSGLATLTGLGPAVSNMIQLRK